MGGAELRIGRIGPLLRQRGDRVGLDDARPASEIDAREEAGRIGKSRSELAPAWRGMRDSSPCRFAASQSKLILIV